MKEYKPKLIVLIPEVLIYLFIMFIAFLFFPHMITALIFLVLGFIPLFRVFYFRSITYTLSEDEEIHKREGIFSLSHDVIPFRNITNMSIDRSVRERMLGLSTMRIQTAGTPYVEMVMKALGRNDAEEIEKIIK